MATYNTLRMGSRGDEVKKLQQKLVDAGYDVGGSGVDGIYGAKTAAAVKQYQQSKGLGVDGIAGEKTLGSLYGTASNTQNTVAQPTTQTAAPTVNPYRYDSGSDTVYQEALKKLAAAKENKPTYAGTYDQQLQAIYDKIMNREDFSYDLNGDALWRQYADQYQQKGQLAMLDTMGQAAALTGGYGSSYGQSVGQQAYQGYLQQLNEQVPALYQLALSKYQADGDKLSEQFAITGELAGDEYAKHQDALTQYWQGVDRAQAEADTAYERGENSWYTEQQLKAQEEETAYAKQQDAYSKLVDLITSSGYSPSQEELAAAGMSAGEATAYRKYYNDQNRTYYTGSSGSGGGTGSEGSTLLTDIGEELEDLIGDNRKDLAQARLDNYLAQGTITQAQYDQLKNSYISKTGATGVIGSLVDGFKNLLGGGSTQDTANYTETSAAKTFRAGLQSSTEFARHNGKVNIGGKSYSFGSYQEYISAALDAALSKGQISEADAEYLYDNLL